VSPKRPASPGPSSVAAARNGSRLRVVAVGGGHAAELAREGLLPGAELTVASRTPLGGPVIVVLGRVRIALSAEVAASVTGELLA
jgi:Fe2+ transport system protein FeoA